jgi:hypothetical protein
LPGSIVPMVSARPGKVAASSVAARIAAAGDIPACTISLNSCAFSL